MIDDKWRNDPKIVEAALYLDKNTFCKMGDRLKANQPFVLSQVKKLNLTDCWLYCVDKTLKDDEDVVLEAVKTCAFAITYASERLRNNEDFLRRAILKNKDVQDYIPLVPAIRVASDPSVENVPYLKGRQRPFGSKKLDTRGAFVR